jgi:hypothetical protein
MASFAALATRNFTTFFAAILIAAPVAGFRPNNSDIGLHEGATSCFWRVPSGADTAPRYSHLLVGGRPSYFFPPWRERTTERSEVVRALETKFLLFWVGHEQDNCPVAVTDTSLSTAGVSLRPAQTTVPPPTWPVPGLGLAVLAITPTAVFSASAAVDGAQSERPCLPRLRRSLRSGVPSDFALRRRFVRSRCMRSARASPSTPKCAAMSA